MNPADREEARTASTPKDDRRRCARSGRPDPEHEFERLYRASYKTVLGYVRCRMGDNAEAEDVVAEAYLKAARSFSAFNPAQAKFSTWVVSIASNCMRDLWRRARPTSCIDDMPEGQLAYPDETDGIADRDLADRLLAALDEGEQRLVLMRYRDGMRNVDIAAELGMNASTVGSRLAGAREKMREAHRRASSGEDGR